MASFAQLSNILSDSRIKMKQVDEHIQLAWEELVMEAKNTSEGHASRDEEEDYHGQFWSNMVKGSNKVFCCIYVCHCFCSTLLSQQIKLTSKRSVNSNIDTATTSTSTSTNTILILVIWFFAVLKLETWNTCETWKERKDDGKTDKSFIHVSVQHAPTSDGTKASGDQEDKKQQQQEKKHDEAEAESKAGASPEQEEPEIAPNTKEIPSAAQEQVPEDGNKTAAAAEEADAEAETQLQTEIPEDNTAKASEVEVAEEAPAPTTSNSVAEAEISGKCPSETTTTQSKDEMAKHDYKNETLPRPPSPTLGTMESQKQKQEEQDKDNQEAEQRQEEQDKENQKQGQDEQDKENQKQRQGEQEKNENENEADQKQEDEQNKGNKKKEEDGKKDDEKKEENKKNEEDQKKDEKKNEEEKQKKRKIDEEQEKQDSDEQRKKQRHKQEKEDEVKKGKGEGDFYSILGVSVDASESDIKKAWKSSSLRLHPDKTGGTTTNEFQRLQMAYETLSDVNKRKAYDRTLAANTAKILRRRTTAGDDSGSDFENGTSFMATVGRWSRKVQKEEDAKKAKKEKAKNEKEKKNKEKKTKATAKSPKAKAMPKLKTKASAAPKKKHPQRRGQGIQRSWRRRENQLRLSINPPAAPRKTKKRVLRNLGLIWAFYFIPFCCFDLISILSLGQSEIVLAAYCVPAFPVLGFGSRA